MHPAPKHNELKSPNLRKYDAANDELNHDGTRKLVDDD